MAIDYAELERRSYRQDMDAEATYANNEPITDKYQVLELLYTHPLENEKPAKRLLLYPISGPWPLGVSEKNRRGYPYVEHVFSGGAYDMEFAGAIDWLVENDVAHRLVNEACVEPAEPNRYRLSHVGIAVLSAYRARMRDADNGMSSDQGE
jgi:hypothetical protein